MNKIERSKLLTNKTTEGFKNEKLDDQKFRDILRPLTDEEYQQLKNDIRENGCLDPIRVWKGKNIIVDGHTRYTIGQELKEELGKDFDFEFEELEFANETAVKEYIYINQMARRNITKEQKRYYIGKLYETMVGSRGGARGQNVHLENVGKLLAEKHKIDERTVRRSLPYAQAIDAITSVSQNTSNRILSGDIRSTVDDILKIGDMEPQHLRHSIESVSSDIKEAFTAENRIKKRNTNIEKEYLSETINNKIADILKDEKFAKIKISVVKENGKGIKVSGRKTTNVEYSLKNKLISFIDKYDLLGLTNAATWEIADGTVETWFKVDKDFIGNIKMKDVRHSLPKQRIEVYKASNLKKQLMIMPHNFEFEINNKLHFKSDKQSTSYPIYNAGLKKPSLKYIPEWDIKCEPNLIFTEKFIRIYEKSDNTEFCFIRENNKIKIRFLTFYKKGLISEITIGIDGTTDVKEEIDTIMFPTKWFANIFKASPYPDKIELNFSNKGFLWIHIESDGAVCDYYIAGEKKEQMEYAEEPVEAEPPDWAKYRREHEVSESIS